MYRLSMRPTYLPAPTPAYCQLLSDAKPMHFSTDMSWPVMLSATNILAEDESAKQPRFWNFPTDETTVGVMVTPPLVVVGVAVCRFELD